LGSCERLMRTPSRASISARRRGIVQLRRSAAGSLSKGVATREAASLFTGDGPGAMLAFSAATPPAAKSLRQSRTYPRARKTPPQSQDWYSPQASAARRAPVRLPTIARTGQRRGRRCSSLATTRDFPAMPHTMQITGRSEAQKPIRWLTKRSLLRSRSEPDVHAM
jgi:hypothetical protein